MQNGKALIFILQYAIYNSPGPNPITVSKVQLEVKQLIRDMFHAYSVAAHKSVFNMIYHNVDVFFVHFWKLFREDNHAKGELPWLFRPSSPAWNTSTLKFGVYVVLNKMYGSSADLRELMQRQ